VSHSISDETPDETTPSFRYDGGRTGNEAEAGLEACATLRGDGDGEADPGEGEEGAGVPVGQAETAVGLGAADLLRRRRSVDTVAGAVQTDPGDADRVVGSGGNDELAAERLGFGGLGEGRGVEGVVGIGDDDGHAEFADGAFFDIAGDAHRKMREKASVGVEGLQGVFGEADFEAGGFGGEGLERDRGDGEVGAGGDGAPVHGRVEGLDEAGAGVGAFGDEFEGGFVGESGLVGFFEPGFAEGLESGDIVGREDKLGEGRGFEEERGARGIVEASGDGERGGGLEGTEGGGGLGAGDAVDGAAGEAVAGEGDLGFKPGFDGARVGAGHDGSERDDGAGAVVGRGGSGGGDGSGR